MTAEALLIAVILLPFVAIFVRAAYLEIRRYVKYGPSQNRRSAFPIDEDAPSYHPPPEVRRQDTASEMEEEPASTHPQEV